MHLRDQLDDIQFETRLALDKLRELAVNPASTTIPQILLILEQLQSDLEIFSDEARQNHWELA